MHLFHNNEKVPVVKVDILLKLWSGRDACTPPTEDFHMMMMMMMMMMMIGDCDHDHDDDDDNMMLKYL